MCFPSINVYPSHLRDMLKCRFSFLVLGWSWDAAFLTSSWMILMALDLLFQEQEPTPLIVFVKSHRSCLACKSTDLGGVIFEVGACDFNQQLRFTYSCHLPQFTGLLQARTVLRSVFLLFKSQVMCLKLTSCSVNVFKKSDFSKHW